MLISSSYQSLTTTRHSGCSRTGGLAFGVPVSTTHAITGAIMGVGATKGSQAVQWGTVRRIVTAWVITIPITAACSFACYLAYTVLVA